MAQKKYLQAKLTQFLREDRIQLWKPPYTDENKKVGLALKDLAKQYSDRLECCENEVEKVIEEIRCKAIERGTGNDNYRTTGIATIEVFLPPRLKKDRKNLLETRLHITGRELRSKAVRGGFRKWHSTHMRRRSCGSAPVMGFFRENTEGIGRFSPDVQLGLPVHMDLRHCGLHCLRKQAVKWKV
uniref:Negative regulator of ubiquitin like proteins 1 n=1 Tax=Pan troglodytes TaxID=9598 RepID=A0A2I3RF10_PANTR